MRALLAAVLMCFSFPVVAQETLGLSGAQLSLAAVEDEDGTYRGDARAALDVAVTQFHGFQGDLAFSDSATGGIGTLAAHLYMTPKPGQKYGLFAALGDVDDRAMLYGSLGAEAMLSIGERTLAEGRAGIGWADSHGLDYIFAGAALVHQLTPSVELELSLNLADFDEPTLSATSHDIGLKATYRPERSPWGAYVSVTQSGLAGHDDALRVGIGLDLTLGTAGGTDPHTRLFRTPDPVASLVRRGLW